MIEMLRKRRSVRSYTEEPVPEEAIRILSEAALRSPTSRNRMAWKFWFIRDADTLKALKGAKKAGSGPVEKAPLAIVVGADTSVTDVWVEDCSIASVLLQLTAQSLGLGSCWIQIRNRRSCEDTSSGDFVKKILDITEDTIAVESIISIGYPAERKSPVPFAELPENAVYLR
ncbi:MAG: nitroreductase family protein [Fibrobacterota bacterium]